MEASLIGKLNACLGLVPVDGNDGANTGLRVSLKNAKKALFIFQFGDSSASTTQFTVNQHTAASSGSSKVCAIANPYFYKVGGGAGANAAAFTKVVPGAAASQFTPTALSTDPGIVVFEVLAEDLDRDNDYAWASIDAADTGAAKLMSCLVLVEPEFLPGHAQSL